MPSDKAAYLAAHYLSTDSPNKSSSSTSKKRKRKNKSAEDGLIIADDDDTSWAQASKRDSDDDDFDGPVLATGVASADFRKAKKSGWKTVGGSSSAAPSTPSVSAKATTQSKEDIDAAAAADAILAQTAAETAALAREAGGDDEVLVVDTTTGATALTRSHQPPETQTQAPIMSNGMHAGLQSASAITAQLKARQEAERLELDRIRAEREQQPEEKEELVLRDATGRRIDASMRRAEARRQQAEAERKEAERKRALKGEVQLEAARRRREELEEAKLMPLARGKDDEQLNAELKQQDRWNDPMAQFLAPEDVGTGTAKGKGGKTRGLGRRPVYKGPAPPNRYGIKPGYRWDGVDRSNGFEGERFRAINRRERNKGLEYAWQMDE